MSAAADVYQAVAVAREAGVAEKLWAHRCPLGCRLVGAYRVRGQMVVVLNTFRPPMWMRERFDLPRKVEGIGWLAEQVPADEQAVGCAHTGGFVRVTTEPRLVRFTSFDGQRGAS